jgi:DNA polymerase III epsilon subunit-like protein
MSDFLYLDTETTGLSPDRGARLVEIAIVDGKGRTVFDSLINPGTRIPPEAANIHGISDAMVRSKPRFEEILPQLLKLVSGREVVIYNAAFDIQFFPNKLSNAQRIHCAMKSFSQAVGQRRWVRLSDAAERVGHVWEGAAHRALADAQACRSVWEWLERQNNVRSPPKVAADQYIRDTDPVAPSRNFIIGTSNRKSGDIGVHGTSSVNVRQGGDFSTPPSKSVERAASVPATPMPVRPSVPLNNTDVVSPTRSATANEVPSKTLAVIKEYSRDLSRIVFTCPSCGTDGRGPDSNLVYCSRCGRWSFTR